MQAMQEKATKVFIGASVLFVILGVFVVITEPDHGNTIWEIFLMKSFIITIFVILGSFALSVAGKYLGSRK